MTPLAAKVKCRVCKTAVVDGECECRETVEVVLGNVQASVTGLVARHGYWPVVKALAVRLVGGHR